VGASNFCQSHQRLSSSVPEADTWTMTIFDVVEYLSTDGQDDLCMQDLFTVMYIHSVEIK